MPDTRLGTRGIGTDSSGLVQRVQHPAERLRALARRGVQATQPGAAGPINYL